MEEQRQANILGLALAHGVVNLANLKQAAALEEPDLIQALQDLGVMDAEDVEALDKSLERRAQGSHGSGDPSTRDTQANPDRASEPAPEVFFQVASGPTPW